MKYILSFLMVAVLTVSSSAQRTELSFRLNSGLGSFSGESTKKSTFMIYSLIDKDGHSNSPYGSKFGASYGVSLNLARVLDSRLKFGAELGAEMLQSKTEIYQVYQHGTSADNATFQANGETLMNSGFLNIFPNVGYRVMLEEFLLDIDVGLDLGYNLGTTEKGFAETESREYETSVDRKTIEIDIRPRVQIGISSKTVGAYVGYSKGLSNYLKDYVGGSNGAYQDVIRFGVYYTLKLRGRDYLRFRRR